MVRLVCFQHALAVDAQAYLLQECFTHPLVVIHKCSLLEKYLELTLVVNIQVSRLKGVSSSACGEFSCACKKKLSRLESVSSKHLLDIYKPFAISKVFSGLRLWWTHKPSVSRAFPSRECFSFVLVLNTQAFPFLESVVLAGTCGKHTCFSCQRVSSGAGGKCASLLVSRVLIKLALVLTHTLVFSKGYKQALVNK